MPDVTTTNLNPPRDPYHSPSEGYEGLDLHTLTKMLEWLAEDVNQDHGQPDFHFFQRKDGSWIFHLKSSGERPVKEFRAAGRSFTEAVVRVVLQVEKEKRTERKT